MEKELLWKSYHRNRPQDSVKRMNIPKDLVAIGEVLKPSGIKGEVKVKSLTPFPERWLKLSKIFLQKKSGEVEIRFLEGKRLKGDFVFLKFREIDSRPAAEELRGSKILINIGMRLKLPPDNYYYDEIIGLGVYTEEGRWIGKIIDILPSKANDVYIVQGEKEYLIPAIRQVIKEIDKDKRKMIIVPLKGLI